jgi:transcriptional regulator GlxA family with amidase domain
MVLNMPSQSGVRAPRRVPCANEAVLAVEAHVRAHPHRTLPVSGLSRLVGLSERGLRNAFYGVHGMSPAHWMRAGRLERVRQALRLAAASGGTVTGVATEHGFYKLGRFAVTYRKTFGERPSDTLRDARGQAGEGAGPS